MSVRSNCTRTRRKTCTLSIVIRGKHDGEFCNKRILQISNKTNELKTYSVYLIEHKFRCRLTAKFNLLYVIYTDTPFSRSVAYRFIQSKFSTKNFSCRVSDVDSVCSLLHEVTFYIHQSRQVSEKRPKMAIKKARNQTNYIKNSILAQSGLYF